MSNYRWPENNGTNLPDVTGGALEEVRLIISASCTLGYVDEALKCQAYPHVYPLQKDVSYL